MQYKYIATNIEGKFIKGEINAESPQDLISNLRSESLFCVQYQKKIELKAIKFYMPTSQKEIALFCKYMSTSLKAGMNICDILNLVSLQFTNKKFNDLLHIIRQSIEKGNTLSEALKNYPKLFPSLLREMVYIGEESGKLQDIFYNMESYYNSTYKRNKKIISSLIYPAFTFILTIIIGFIMIFKVLPQFASHITNLQGELPKITKFYLGLGNCVSANGGLFVFMVALTIVVTYFIVHKFFFKKDIYFMLYKLPVVGSMYKKAFYARFTYTMYILLQSGMDIISSLNMAMKCEESQWICKALAQCSKDIEEGQSIYDALNAQSIFPKFFMGMIRIGEENGNLDNMLNTANEIFENELSTSLERFSALIEPILILLLGVFVGTIVLAIMLPLIKLSTVGI